MHRVKIHFKVRGVAWLISYPEVAEINTCPRVLHFDTLDFPQRYALFWSSVQPSRTF